MVKNFEKVYSRLKIFLYIVVEVTDFEVIKKEIKVLCKIPVTLDKVFVLDFVIGEVLVIQENV